MGCTAFVLSGGNIFVALLASLLCGALVGAFYGNMVTMFKLPPFIAGLAISSIAEGIVMIYTNASPIQGIKGTWFSWLGQGYIFSIPTPIVICLVMMVATWFILRKTTFGRHCVATGGNRAAAEACGIRTKRVINTVYIMDGVLCALASCVFMGRLGVSSYYQLLAKGIMILVAVIVDMKTKESIAKSDMKK